MTRAEEFKHPHWNKRRWELLDEAGSQCVECGGPVDDAVHICYYPKAQRLWEFPQAAFRVLCPPCRTERAALETSLRVLDSHFTNSELGILVDVLDDIRSCDPVERPRILEELRGARKRAAPVSYADGVHSGDRG